MSYPSEYFRVRLRAGRALPALTILALVVSGFAMVDSARAASNLLVDPDGFAAVGDCGDTSTPAFTTIGAAISAAVGGDTVSVCPATYNENVAINKSLMLIGPQAGVDARTRTAVPEAALTNGVSVGASGVTIDGFTISDADGVADYGPGINVPGSVSGTQVLNNVIRNNVFGLYLGNEGTSQAVVQFNLFDANNRLGAASGQGIYSDQRLVNATIEDNKFSGQSTYAIDLTGGIYAYGPVSMVTIARNDFSGRGVIVSGQAIDWNPGALTTDLDILDNTFSTDSRQALRLFGVDNATVTGNTISGYGDAGIDIQYGGSAVTITDNHIDSSGRGVYVHFYAPRDQYTIVRNSFTSNTTAIDNGQDDDISLWTMPVPGTCNWWGAADGPSGPGGAGSGDSVSANVDFSLWLTSSNLNGDCIGGTPSGTRQVILATLEDLLDNGGFDAKTDKRIQKAIDGLEKSMTPSWWDGPLALSPKHGNKVFDQDKKVVHELLSKELAGNPTAQSLIQTIVSVDRSLAQYAIDNAVGISQKDIDKANDELAKGDAMAADGNYEEAIGHYKHAWEKVAK